MVIGKPTFQPNSGTEHEQKHPDSGREGGELNHQESTKESADQCPKEREIISKQINEEFGSQLDMPIVYFTQLLGIAYGIDPKTLGMNKHLSDAIGLLRNLELLPA